MECRRQTIVALKCPDNIRMVRISIRVTSVEECKDDL